jgi:hypothetical protein
VPSLVPNRSRVGLTSVSRGRLVSWLSVVVLALLTLESAVLSVTNSGGASSGLPSGAGSQTSLAGFAGYDLLEPVTDIGADFSVPAIISTPQGSFATASTWIGAQNTQGSFVQVGVTEFVGKQSAGSGYQTSYTGFWSSTAKSFHPIEFGTLRAGDRIAVRMRQQKSGWLLSFRDRTSDYSHTVSTGYAGGQPFGAAEWIQEDPVSSSAPLRNLPYPSMSDSMFTSLEVDGKSPRLNGNDGRAMDVPFGGPLLVPGVFRSDGFEVFPAKGFAKQYLSDVADYNYAQEAFAAAIDEAGPGSFGTKVRAALSAYGQALAKFEDQLSSQTWPAGARTDVDSLISDNRTIASSLSQLGPTGQIYQIELDILSDESTAAQAAENVRKDLGLPPPA